jgi:hypothetical protein
MKRTIFILGIVAIILFSFRMASSEPHNAQVYKWQGFYVFMECSPTSDYTVLGTVKEKGIVWTGKPKEMFNTILRRVRKDYPNADGVIFDPINGKPATCIKFKD